MTALRRVLDTLAGLAHPDGGWGYVPGQAAHPEPTCLGLLALSLEPQPYQPVLEKARAALKSCAQLDGTWRLARGREEAIWPTALALFTHCTLGAPAEAIAPTAAALLHLQGRQPRSDKAHEVHDIDLSLIGWAWAEGNFSWVEPTAWACLALRRAGHGEHPRVQQGLQLLLDRTFDEGGINYGNRHILGKPLEPVPGPTALMLLALQGHHDQPRVAASVRYLGQAATLGDDLEHLCWARIALTPYASLPGVPEVLQTLDARIVQAHEARPATPWVQPSPLRESLTALALGTEQGAPFVLPSNPKPLPLPKTKPPAPGRRSFGEKIRNVYQGMVANALSVLKTLDPRSQVHIAPVSNYQTDIADVLARQYECFRERVPFKGKRVVLKPNLVEYHRDKVINTHPHVVAAAIELCRREGAAEVIVAEGPGHWRNVEYLVSASGLGDVLRHYKVPFVDLNHDEPVKQINQGRLTGLPYLYLAQTIVKADVLISMPKLKTHHWAVATLSLKNLFGTLPGICYGWPKNELHWRGIDNSIVDIALTRTPELAIVDGIVGMEGDGPLNGTPKPLGVLVMGCDLLAVDATCCRLMKLNPEKVPYLVLGAGKKLGQLAAARIPQLGESIAARAQAFETLPQFEALHA